MALLAPWIIGAALLGLLYLHQDVSTTSAVSTTSLTTTTIESVAGKPCVAVVDPLPAGAPEVPVEVGPPPTKIVIKDIKTGTGSTVATTGSVTVNYIGVACSTGKIFATSYPIGGAETIPLDWAITGWAKGVTGMKVGGKRLLGIPSTLAYGTDGEPPNVAPDEAVWIVVEVTGTHP